MSDHDGTLRPREWTDYIGQAALKARLDVHIKAAVDQNRPLQDMLLIGPPGVGKTTLAQVIADRLGDPFLAIARPLPERAFQQELYRFGVGVVLLDEIHRLTKASQEALLTLIGEDSYLERAQGGRLDFEFLTVIGATTEPHNVIKPLLDRFVVHRLTSYTDAEMAQIVVGMGLRAGVTIDGEDALVLGRAAGGVPRIARQFVLAYRDLEQVNGFAPFPDDVVIFCDAEPDGLTADHVRYLAELDRLGGQAGIDLLAAQMQLHLGQAKDIERLLLDRGYLSLGPGGRYITGDGRARLMDNQPPVRTGRFRRGA